MRGRGIDFEHRFKTSRWAEDLLISALEDTQGLLTVRFGLSEVRAEDKLEYGNSPHKEPDLLVFKLTDLTTKQKTILETVDLTSQPRSAFSPKGDLKFALDKASAAIEVEFSPYRASEMKQRNWQPRTLEKWQQRPLKRANPPIAPNIFVKEEDIGKLLAWENKFGVPIVVVHLFDQESFAIRLAEVGKFDKRYNSRPSDRVMLQVTTGIFKLSQTYDRVDAQGAREEKVVFRVSPSAAIKVGDVREVKVTAQLGISASKKYVSHVLFTKGKIKLSPSFVEMLKSLRD